MGGAGALGGAGAVLAAELCAPLLLLCWLCCWPDDASDSSSGKHPARPVITGETTSHRRLHEPFGRRFGSSAVSLHLPSTSGGIKQSLSAHRSHEEIRGRRKSQPESGDNEGRYHSAPSVIDEVLHRRDWERSTKELHIPLRPEGDVVSVPPSDNTSPHDDSSPSDDWQLTDEQIVGRTCKKHYTNIKSSKKKEADVEQKDDDATETSSFYIGEHEDTPAEVVADTGRPHTSTGRPCSALLSPDVRVHKPKESKQSLNESIKSKERMKQTLVPVEEFKVSRFDDSNIDFDRSGAIHHSMASRSSLRDSLSVPAPPPSVEAVGYDTETWQMEEMTTWAQAPGPPDTWGREVHYVRARHASAGDVLAPALRPHSAALSESELDFELEACDELPPSYNELHLLPERKETAI